MTDQEKTPEIIPVATPVIAIEYNGNLYSSFQNAEGARAKSDLMNTLISKEISGYYDQNSMYVVYGQNKTIDSVLENAERVHGILSRYLDAAKIELPATP